ncbi:elongation factor 1-gamma (EF-1-gamma) [Trypanosoma cruzi]|nr:elongation factor 1-gamma (EF-1-gamma) [Trypanosoma cruzi]
MEGVEMCEGGRCFRTFGLPLKDETSRQPLAAPGRGLRGCEVCSNKKDNEMQCVTVRLIGRVVVVHGARAPVLFVSCAHDWGAEWRHDIVALCVLCAAVACRRL